MTVPEDCGERGFVLLVVKFSASPRLRIRFGPSFPFPLPCHPCRELVLDADPTAAAFSCFCLSVLVGVDVVDVVDVGVELDASDDEDELRDDEVGRRLSLCTCLPVVGEAPVLAFLLLMVLLVLAGFAVLIVCNDGEDHLAETRCR